jgi:hypothetical protein
MRHRKHIKGLHLIDWFLRIDRGLDKLALLLDILRRGKDEIFNVTFADDLDVTMFLPLASDHAVEDNSHDPNHPQEDTNTASEDERNCPAFPRSERHERMVNSPQECLLMVAVMVVVVVVVMAVMTTGVVLHVRGTNFTTVSTDEGEGMNKPVSNTRVSCGVDFGLGQPEGLLDCVRETERRSSEIGARRARATPGGGEVLRARLVEHHRRRDVRNVGVVGVTEARDLSIVGGRNDYEHGSGDSILGDSGARQKRCQ